MAEKPNPRLHRLAAPLIEVYGWSRGVAVAFVLVAGILVAAAVLWFLRSGPPDTITISTGAPGSSFQRNAEKYQALLAKKGFTLKILSSQGSLENLTRLNDPASGVDLGFVQGGITNDPDSNKLMSLGSITYAPLLVFYRSRAPVTLLSGFAGRRVAIGSAGSGTHSLALQLFALNGIKPDGVTTFSELDGDAAAAALLQGSVDAIFLMSDSTSQQVMTNMLHSPGVQLFDFAQADGYARRISYVNKLVLPEGSLDFGQNYPARDLNLLGPTVELLARPNLHPAISDLLLEAMKKTHRAPGLFKRRDEFPAPIPHDFPISRDAARYYTSGPLYPWLPFWLAIRLNRLVVSALPLLFLVPALRLIPGAFRWRMQVRINRWYRALLMLERDIPDHETANSRARLMTRLENVEAEVNKMKVPASFANQFYSLRGHITFVRDQLAQSAPPV